MHGILGKIAEVTSLVRNGLKIGWSEAPGRTASSWLDYFHKSPMLDPVHMIAQDFSATGFKLYSKSQYRKDSQNAEPIGSHALFDLLENPMPDHPEIDMATIFYLTDVFYEIVGEGFWLIDRAGRNPSGIYPLPPTWVLRTPTAHSSYFEVFPMGNTSRMGLKVDPADMVWFKAPNASNPYGRGRARGEAIGDEVETHEFSSKYAKNFFYNDATPPIVLEMPGISKADADTFKESWLKTVGGFLNARKPAIVGQKDFKIHKLTDSPREMDLVESRKYLIQAANEHFCVPPEMRGNTQNSNRATIDSAYYLWSKNVVTKRIKTFQSQINRQFVPMFGNDLIWIYDNIVPDDNEAKMKLADAGLEMGTITVNEWRKIASTCGITLPPDEHRGNVYIRKLMDMEVVANEEPEKQEPEPIPPKAAPVENEEGKIDLAACIKEIEECTAKIAPPESERKGWKSAGSSFTDEQKDAIWKAFDKSATASESLFKTAVKKFAGIQEKIVLENVENAKTSDEMKAGLAKVFTSESDEALKRALAPGWLASMRVGRDNAMKLIDKKKADTDALTNEWFNKWVDKAGLKKAKEINKTTNKELRETLSAIISESIDAGEPSSIMAAKIEEACAGVYDNMTTTRANTIARTESGSSMNAGTYATYKIEGVQKKEWIAVRDARTRDAHSVADGQIVGINEKFTVGGEMLDYPGDANGSAENVINERCTTAPVFED
jgi:HK97 family phage portal protein